MRDELLCAARRIFDVRSQISGVEDELHRMMAFRGQNMRWREEAGQDSGRGFRVRLLLKLGADAVRFSPLRLSEDGSRRELFTAVPTEKGAGSVYSAYASLHELAGIREAFLRAGDPTGRLPHDMFAWRERFRRFLARSHECLFNHLAKGLKALGKEMPGYYWLPLSKDRPEDNALCQEPGCGRLRGWIIGVQNANELHGSPPSAGERKRTDVPSCCPPTRSRRLVQQGKGEPSVIVSVRMGVADAPRRGSLSAEGPRRPPGSR